MNGRSQTLLRSGAERSIEQAFARDGRFAERFARAKFALARLQRSAQFGANDVAYDLRQWAMIAPCKSVQRLVHRRLVAAPFAIGASAKPVENFRINPHRDTSFAFLRKNRSTPSATEVYFAIRRARFRPALRRFGHSYSQPLVNLECYPQYVYYMYIRWQSVNLTRSLQEARRCGA